MAKKKPFAPKSKPVAPLATADAKPPLAKRMPKGKEAAKAMKGKAC